MHHIEAANADDVRRAQQAGRSTTRLRVSDRMRQDMIADLPELGLSNWENGRLLGRAGVLTGSDLTTRRMYTHQRRPAPLTHPPAADQAFGTR
ncbi:hypothetical protein [Myceligenerans pegani]|uniref:Uncharacterized protein n=1 Tax=Myceligenerans pegani TaxID=2776917 RepID=A0ABR9N449_9MICO|nr:hypothetical protein [Myceligenerans sp. TRM 65318]MBE1878445.1 hypothetical protein [Myceligenerans sp. TRM 65318]MBE3020716.1 hypothetical protein [Myceligenerans sp. TRM 65318]